MTTETKDDPVTVRAARLLMKIRALDARCDSRHFGPAQRRAAQLEAITDALGGAVAPDLRALIAKWQEEARKLRAASHGCNAYGCGGCARMATLIRVADELAGLLRSEPAE